MPVLVLPEATERPTGVDAEAVKLVSARAARIDQHTKLLLLENQTASPDMARATNPYGDGNASSAIRGWICADEATDRREPGSLQNLDIDWQYQPDPRRRHKRMSRFRRSMDRLASRVRIARFGIQEFVNFPTYFWLLRRGGNGHAVLRTRDGISLTLRKNRSDARIVTETFMVKPYLRHDSVRQGSVIIDVGAYMGDFAVYTAYRYTARVVAVEPTAENRAVLEENIQNNNLDEHISVVPVAIGKSGWMAMNVQTLGGEIHASPYWYAEAECRELPSWTLDELLERSKVQHVDLLKLDCEGCEYDALESVTDTALARIAAIVMEYHIVPGWATRLEKIIARLRNLGFRAVSCHDQILYFERK